MRKLLLLSIVFLFAGCSNSIVPITENQDTIRTLESTQWHLLFYSRIGSQCAAEVLGYDEPIYVKSGTMETFNDPYHPISFHWHFPYTDSTKSPIFSGYHELYINNFSVLLGDTLYLADTSYILWKLSGGKLTKIQCTETYPCD